MHRIIEFFLWIFSFLSSVKKVEESEEPREEDVATVKPFTDPKWYRLAKAELGVKEYKGDDDNPRVLRYYADAGHPEIDNDEVAWCSAFVGAMLERSGRPCSKSLAARSYLQWGKKLSKPKIGCVVVFSRGNPRGWQGHVGFYAGETKTHILVLGGNQRNQVSVAKYPKSRLLGYRQPVTGMNSRTYAAAGVGVLGAGVSTVSLLSEGIAEVLKISNELKALGSYFPVLSVVGSFIAILGFMTVIYARRDDLEQKGR